MIVRENKAEGKDWETSWEPKGDKDDTERRTEKDGEDE